jgi:alkanesulfonate monooxygenase SsuD/methylene tetrahydromethanopterin reductase-like flavin-dependent oxidoreductase (luciferase family)
VRLGVAVGWHRLVWEELLELTRHAEALGYAALYHDGDVSMLARRRAAEVLDGWTVTTALLAHTRSIAVGSIRLVHFWNAARLAQSAATAARLAPGRFRFLVGVGDRPEDPRFGLPLPPAGQRVAWLDETLEAARALWRGESVTQRGRFVTLEGARVTPTPPAGALPVEIAAKGPRLLRVVARHADVWNVNLPPIPRLVGEAEQALADACGQLGRDPGSIARHLWIFMRPQARRDPGAALAEFRRFNPWFADLPDAQLSGALLAGSGAECADQLRALCRDLRIDLPVLDLSGLGLREARRALEQIPAGGIELTRSPAVA